jgi:pimeloyl-ACP methyl ester carboxylesterase
MTQAMTAEERLIKTLGVRADIEYIKTQRGELFSVNAGTGEDLLLIHGMNMGWGEWHPIIGALAKKFRIHAIDLPGAGNSLKFNITEKKFGEYFTEAVNDYLDAKKFQKINIIGHSVGAWVALRLMIAGRAEVDKAVLVSPLGFTARTPTGQRMLGSKLIAHTLSKTVMRPTRKNIESFLAGVFYNKSALAAEFTDYYHEALTEKGTAHPFLFTNRLAGMSKVRDEFNLIPMLGMIRRPVMIVVGVNDPIVKSNAMNEFAFAQIPGAIVRRMEKSGHVPFTEHPQEFIELVTEFLEML